MPRPFTMLFTAAVAALALLGPALPVSAQTAQPAAVQEPLLSEVLIDTRQGWWLIDAVEVVNPDQVSLNGYKIRHCNETGALIDVVTLTGQSPRVVADNTFGDWNYIFYGDLDRQGGLVLIAANGDVVDAVTFNPTNPLVTGCLTGDPLGTPDVSPPPTTTQSAQRNCDTGPWDLAEPTLGKPNTCTSV